MWLSHDALRDELASFSQTKMADLDRWIDIAKDCKYLPEHDLKVSKCPWILSLVNVFLSPTIIGLEYFQKGYLFCSECFTPFLEIMWLCLWFAAWGVQCAASFITSNRLWRHSRTGSYIFLCLDWCFRSM